MVKRDKDYVITYDIMWGVNEVTWEPKVKFLKSCLSFEEAKDFLNELEKAKELNTKT